MRIALIREVSPSIANCELTHVSRTAIDVDLATKQHRRYEEVLVELGCDVRRLPPLPDQPDAVFVEDTAVVFDELAVIARPGAATRRAEAQSVADALAPQRTLEFIASPGTLDGGDVLRLGRRVFVGLSQRTNREGIDQLRSHLSRHNYTVTAVPVAGCLHLKTAVTAVAEGAILVHRAWVDVGIFGDVASIDVDPAEPYAANALLVGETVVYPAAYPRTRERLERQGIPVAVVDVSELAKAEGGVTCCSLSFNVASEC